MQGESIVGKNQSNSLAHQHKYSKGVIGIFGKEAKLHDAEVSKVAAMALEVLKSRFP